MIYFVLFFVLLSLAIIYDFKAKLPPNSKVVFAFILLVFMAGFRYRVGTDTLVYMDEYNTKSLSFIQDKYLVGWFYFVKVCKLLHLNFYLFQFIIAIIINYGVFVCIRSNMRNIFFSCLLLYYTLLYPGWNFEILRQAICISLFFIALNYYDKGKTKLYFILIGIACTIHETALFLLLVPLLLWIKLNNKLLYVSLGPIAALVVFAPYVRDAIFYYAFMLAPFQDKAAYYFGDVTSDNSFSLVAYTFNIFLNIIIPFVVIRYDIKRKYFSNTFNILLLLYMVTYVLSMMLPMLYRLNSYFSLFGIMAQLYAIASVSKQFNCSKIRNSFVFLLLIFAVFKGRLYFTERDGVPMYVHYYPYTNILDEREIHMREILDRYLED